VWTPECGNVILLRRPLSSLARAVRGTSRTPFLMRRSIALRTLALLAGVAGLLLPGAAAGQAGDSVRAAVPIAAAAGATRLTVGGERDERARLAQVLGNEGTAGYLLRSAGPGVQSGPAAAGGLTVFAPEARVVWNSDLPFSLNEGSLWAGRGVSTRVRWGAQAGLGRVLLTLMPEATYSQNRRYQVRPNVSGAEPRNAYASPFHGYPQSADLPSRFGADAAVRLSPGQSSLVVPAGAFRFGAATATQWWGPGVRNALVMSGNAPAIPHAFFRTGRPLRTGIGEVEGVWMLGWLTESSYFDFRGGNKHRSLSAFAATFRPAGEPGLTVGVTRAVYSPLAPMRFLPSRALDAFLPAHADTLSSARPREQILGLFGRWVFPESGLETYVEWATRQPPGSLRELLATPERGRAYTVGLQWAHPLEDGGAFRVQAEATNLQQDSLAQSFYTSAVVGQGYTQRGRTIGAAIGPGASSQWVAADLFRRTWRLGVSVGRYRWDDDAFYQFYTLRTPVGHDVSLLGGVHFGHGVGPFAVEGEVLSGTRFNYLFQNSSSSFSNISAVDVRNFTASLTLSRPVR
jgi:hypothetical protein